MMDAKKLNRLIKDLIGQQIKRGNVVNDRLDALEQSNKGLAMLTAIHEIEIERLKGNDAVNNEYFRSIYERLDALEK